jgi:hypothetical protein
MKSVEKNYKVQATTKTTDNDGKVILMNIPVGLYEIEVEGNSAF